MPPPFSCEKCQPKHEQQPHFHDCRSGPFLSHVLSLATTYSAVSPNTLIDSCQCFFYQQLQSYLQVTAAGLLICTSNGASNRYPLRRSTIKNIHSPFFPSESKADSRIFRHTPRSMHLDSSLSMASLDELAAALQSRASDLLMISASYTWIVKIISWFFVSKQKQLS